MRRSNLLERATWPAITALAVGAILCLGGFRWRRRVVGSDLVLLDARCCYRPEDVQALFAELQARGQLHTYALTELTLDLVFPLIYGALFAALLARLAAPGWARRFIALPVGAAGADLLENFTIAYLAWTFDGQASPLAWLAYAFTLVKDILLAATLLAVLVALAIRILHRYSDRPAPA